MAVARRAERSTHTTSKFGREANDMIREQRPVRTRTHICEDCPLAAAVGHIQDDTANHGAPVVARGAIVPVVGVWQVHDGAQAGPCDRHVGVALQVHGAVAPHD